MIRRERQKLLRNRYGGSLLTHSLVFDLASHFQLVRDAYDVAGNVAARAKRLGLPVSGFP